MEYYLTIDGGTFPEQQLVTLVSSSLALGIQPLLTLTQSTMAQTWEEKVAVVSGKRNASLAKVEPALGQLPAELPLNSQSLPKDLLTPREIEITEAYTVKQLLAKLRSREISVEEVTRAFLRRAAVAHACVSLSMRHSRPDLLNKDS